MCTLIIASLRDSGFMVGFMTEMEFMVCLIMVNDMGVLIFSTKIVMECDKLEFFFSSPTHKNRFVPKTRSNHYQYFFPSLRTTDSSSTEAAVNISHHVRSACINIVRQLAGPFLLCFHVILQIKLWGHFNSIE